MPPNACTPDGYKSFFEAFVRNPDKRDKLTLPTARLADFDMAMRDYSWVLASNADTALDIDEARSGGDFNVRAKPVELDDNDEVIKVLGPQRTYRFKHVDGCWKFASAE